MSDTLAAAMVIALTRSPKRWNTIGSILANAKRADVPHPVEALEAALDGVSMPKALVKRARELALIDGDFEHFGVAKAITAVAHSTSHDAVVRSAMERAAGEYLAAA